MHTIWHVVVLIISGLYGYSSRRRAVSNKMFVVFMLGLALFFALITQYLF